MTPAHIPALRLTLRSMLADATYADAWKSRPWVEDRLAEAGWSEETWTALKVLALRWVNTQRDDVRSAMWQALGEAVSEEDAARLPSPARLGSTRHALTTTLEGVVMATITQSIDQHNSTIVRPEDGPVSELFGDPDWSELDRQADLLLHAPWDYTKAQVDKAKIAYKAGKITLGVPPTSLAYVQSEDGARTYTVREKGCTCRATHPCYHPPAAELYRLMQSKLESPSLFPTPKTVDERLASSPQDAPGSTTRSQAGQLDAETPTGQPGAKNEVSPMADMPKAETFIPEPSPVLDEAQLTTYRHTIAKQLGALGHKPKNKSEYEELIMTLVGLVLAPENFPLIRDRLSEIITTRTRLAPAPIPEVYLVDIKGKQHVLFAGLLAMAHEKGLLTLAADFISVTADLALARATATFQDGRSFTEAADATPNNVGPQVKPHFARMALTRAKARVLRDALNINAVAAEEVE